MQYALQLPNRGRSLAVRLAAALLGTGVATTSFALTDSDKAPPPEVVIVGSSEDGSPEPATPMSGARP
jgi:hypothetical protein